MKTTRTQEYADKAYNLVYQQGIGEFGKAVRDAIVDTALMLAGDDGVDLDDAALRAYVRSLA